MAGFQPSVVQRVDAAGRVRHVQVGTHNAHVGEVVTTDPLVIECPCAEPLKPRYRTVPVTAGMRVLVIEVGAELIVTGEVLDA